MNKIKISLLAVAMITLAIACKKKIENVSDVVTASRPTITITGQQFYSIPVGGTIPTVSATAYDSVLMESYPTQLDASGLDNTQPGMYFVPIKATNKYGYIGTLNVVVAVTEIADSVNLAGTYKRTATGQDVIVEEVANGVYSVDNLFGAATTPGSYAYFVQIDDSTMDMPTQPTPYGELSTSDRFLHVLPTDTSYGYKISSNLTSNKALRVFVKQ